MAYLRDLPEPWWGLPGALGCATLGLTLEATVAYPRAYLGDMHRHKLGDPRLAFDLGRPTLG